jgi:hypothetical protein
VLEHFFHLCARVRTCRVDSSLDELEANPLPLQKAVYDISRGPVGSATSSVVAAAARLTLNATTTAAKAAAPLGR